MKILRWVVGIVCGLSALLVLVALCTTPALQTRQATFGQWDRESLAALGLERPDEEDPPTTILEPPASATPDSPQGLNTGSGMRALSSSPAHAVPANSPGRGSLALWDRALTRVYLVGLKRVEAATWIATTDSPSSFMREIGHESFQAGDDETARRYLRELLRTEANASRREHICRRLAWVEEDPEIAAALLRESCATNRPGALSDAMRLAILTNSNEVADHYFERWADAVGEDEVARWFNSHDRSPRIQAWKEQREREDEEHHST